jgi:hypothetical protein
MSRALSVAAAAACACATPQQAAGPAQVSEQPHRIFVGHSNDGEVLVSSAPRG